MDLSNKTAAIKFWAPWCGPCKVVAPFVQQAAESIGVEVIEVNVDENPDVAQQFGVRALPTVVTVKGGEFVAQLVGTHKVDQYNELFSKLVETKPEQAC